MKTNSKLFAFAVMAFMLVGAFAIVADQGGSDADVGTTFVEGDYTYTILTEGDTPTVSIAATTPAEYTGSLDLSTLTEVTHDTVTYTITGITKDGFRDASGLNSITFNGNITDIGSYAFSGTALTTVTIPDTVNYIGNNLFNGCTSLSNVSWGLQSIANAAFSGCTGLTSFDFTNITTIKSYAFYECTGLTSIDLANVTSIGNRAFMNAGLTSIDLANVTGIGERAFANTSLIAVTVPATVTNIDTNAFNGCTSLTNVTWGPATIANAAFSGCTGLTSFDFTGITNIANYAFYGTGLTSATFHGNITINKSAFENSQIRSITFEGTNNSITNMNAFPKANYVYANGAVLDDWSPALTTTPVADTYVATYQKVDDSWSTEPSISETFNYGVGVTYTSGTPASGNEVTYKFVGTKGTVYVESETAPTDAGTYALHAYTADTPEFNALSSYYEFEILKAENSWTTPFSMETTEFTYPDAVTYTAGVAAHGEVYYVITDANNNAVDGWPTEVGTYSVYAVVDETVNYAGLSTEENAIQFTIALPSGEDVAVIDGTTYSTIAAAQEAELTEFIVDMDLVEDVVLASGQSIIFVTGATFTGSIEYTIDAETPVTSALRAINLVAGSPIVIAPGSIELSGTMSADYLVLSGEVVVTANTTISAGTILVFADDCVLTNENDATLTIESGAYCYNAGATLPTDPWFVNNGTAVAADYIGDNEVSVAMTSAGQVYLTLDIEDAYVGDITGASFVRVSWTVTDSEDATIKHTGEAVYANDADAFGILVGNLDLGDYTISMHMYYVYEYTNVVRSISVDKPFTVLPQDIIIGAYYGQSAYHAVLYNVFGENLAAGTINVDAFTAQTGELSDGTEYQYIDITSTLTADVDGTTAGGAYDLEGTVDIENMVALQPWYQIAGSSAKLYAFETVAYSTTPAPVTADVDAYNDLAAVVSIAVGEVDGGFGEVDGGVWVYAVEALDGATLTAVVDDEHIYTAEVTLGDDGFKFFDFETDFVDADGNPADISGQDIAYFYITALTVDGTTVTDAHLSLVVLDYQ